ncbi:UDP-N-acetylglucosamine acyltransferase lpxA [Candidatus Kinetoplastibacterium blastocrithidii TCC012E]|uniref:Acyl-[acyl-carrier-protein]--UDP-N-acetylglucosamine O-acyltransferase n=1 Tax=Candidatus Kinetoplastidibacterium blastocrithidiae TCC012E TaxID=1208922 RepID=M1M0G7_9PROT|nr:acyl-ACP--UDP-N-acetylglucosamine O-acyltransferase [Candidatus Kinetoplastibacterium blastocrithidii]AFZ83640.1 UDP-N-acetylglucosamine acyltransferase [Candidatus Kinetoplastibacterium blastocrithidii (ex Strigomonas culicis)]AGF49761.1 UDP-N-acetylglucosamine acyltransferase lpxA [Candidatus Kinetoplastibacterium blastocrithidii TCC012E]
MNRNIHPTAIVDISASIDSSVVIGPYVVIGPKVCIDSGTVVGSHCVIDGDTTIGKNNQLYRFCSIGGVPQDKKYKLESTKLIIGNHNTIREFTTFNIGTVQDESKTIVGDGNWIMAYVHIAHDCCIGNNVTLANSVQLGGHVTIDDWAIIGGLTGIHQFSKIGAHVMVGSNSSLIQDVPPFVLCAGNPSRPFGVNIEGLKRRNFSDDVILEIKKAYKTIYRQGLSLIDAKSKLQLYCGNSIKSSLYLKIIIDFLDNSSRGIIR